jgi:lipoprotein-anchoring transpeptidase ErfK/SrfK
MGGATYHGAVRRTHPALRTTAAATALAALLAGCTGGSVGEAVAPPRPASVDVNVPDDATDVPVDTLVRLGVEHGTVTEAALESVDGAKVPGEGGESGWSAAARLEPATAYVLRALVKGDDGAVVQVQRSFTTQQLTLDEQTYPSVAPLEGETVGVGMPVIVTFDIPVRNRKLFEQHMHVRSTPEVTGSWHWISDSVVHYRPERYWPAGTKVTVDLDLNSLPAGGGVYGQQDQHVPFTVGRRVVTTVDVAKHTLTMNVDGKDVRTIPVSTGKPGHETRGGTKVVMEKFSSVDMDAASTGVDRSDPDYYDISDVRWAMRVTNSGEFLHAAPWSVGSQGRENVSHGCVGMSTADAKWVYDRSRRGDVVRFVNSSRRLEDNNGWTDWNVDWTDWEAGSALAASS